MSLSLGSEEVRELEELVQRVRRTDTWIKKKEEELKIREDEIKKKEEQVEMREEDVRKREEQVGRRETLVEEREKQLEEEDVQRQNIRKEQELRNKSGTVMEEGIMNGGGGGGGDRVDGNALALPLVRTEEDELKRLMEDERKRLKEKEETINKRSKLEFGRVLKEQQKLEKEKETIQQSQDQIKEKIKEFEKRELELQQQEKKMKTLSNIFSLGIQHMSLRKGAIFGSGNPEWKCCMNFELGDKIHVGPVPAVVCNHEKDQWSTFEEFLKTMDKQGGNISMYTSFLAKLKEQVDQEKAASGMEWNDNIVTQRQPLQENQNRINGGTQLVEDGGTGTTSSTARGSPQVPYNNYYYGHQGRNWRQGYNQGKMYSQKLSNYAGNGSYDAWC